MKCLAVSLSFFVLFSASAPASILFFGDQDCLGAGCYGVSDPTAGATLQGLAPNAVTQATNSFGHGFPFTPGPGDFAGTDQIYVGGVQTGANDGYSVFSGRLNGPQVLVLNYASLVPSGQTVTSLTLGIAADDFQFPAFQQPFTATINGSTNTTLVNTLSGLNETGPQVHFFTIGLNPAIDTAAHTLTLSIDEGGNGGDGWAVDFLSVGVTTNASAATPEPAPIVLLVPSLLLLWRRARTSKV